MEFKQYKEAESKIHEGLFINLLLLSEFYPTTNEFNAILKRDMFVKNNKTAFFEVIYYLLNILNPEFAKKHLTSWPPYDLKREAKFRNEIVAYLNTINSTYDNADIPACQASSLISPGGFRFARLMFKISQLVIYEHLKKLDKHNLLYRLKSIQHSSAATCTQKSNLENTTKLIEKETKESLLGFNENYLKVSQKAKEIQKRMDQLDKDIQSGKRQLGEAQVEFENKYPTYPSLSSLEEQLVDLKQRIEKIMEIDDIFCSSEKLLKYIGDSKMTLEHTEDKFTVPGDIAHIVTNKKELDLNQLFQGVSVLLEKSAVLLQSPSLKCMEQTKITIESFTEKTQRILTQLLLEQEHVSNQIDNLKEFIQELQQG